jgi:hypothetical protein
MWQELRDYWLPMMLFAVTLLFAILFLLLIIISPMLVEYFDHTNRVLHLFSEDATVRRTCIAGAIGLLVTAFVFFRPNPIPPKKSSPKKPPSDTMAGA